MDLQLKHLAPYLPYGLKGIYYLQDVVSPYKSEERGKELSASNVDFFLNYCKPILKPMSDLKYGSVWFIHIFDITTNYHWENSVSGLMLYPKEVKGMWPQYILDYLFSNHFDVFGLIEAGLAIDINTLQ